MEHLDLSHKQKIIAGQHTRERDYWLEKLSGLLEKTAFPYDHGKTGIDSSPGEHCVKTLEFEFDRELFSRLMHIGNKSDFRLHMILTAGLVVLLSNYTGSSDIIFGTPTVKQAVDATFINTVMVLRNRLRENVTFRDLLVQVRQTLSEAAENVNYPLEILLNDLNLPVSRDSFPLFDVALLLENIHDKRYIQHIRLNMIFSFSRQDGSIKGVLEFNSSLYEKNTVERIASHFTHLLHQLVLNVDFPVTEIDILSKEEKERILYEFNDITTTYPRDKTIPELFEESVARAPHSTALVFGDHVSTYRRLTETSNRLAVVLRNKGLGLDTIVGIIAEHSIEMIIGILGILKAGGAYLPIDPDYPEDRVNYMLKDSSTELLVTTGNLVKESEKVKKWEGEIFFIEGFLDSPSPLTFSPSPLLNPQSLAYVIYTSGTMGKPKGTLTTHINAIRVVKKTNYIDLNRRDRLLQLSNYAFDGSVFDIFGALLNGAALIMFRRGKILTAERVVEVIERDCVTVFFVTTAFFNTLVDLEIESLKNVRKILFGGEKISPEHSGKALEYLGKGRLIHVYGPTETTVFATYYFIEHIDETLRTVPIGKPIANTTAYILDKYLKPVPIGVTGEIYIGGEGVARGYLNNPELTAERFDNVFGDRGFFSLIPQKSVQKKQVFEKLSSKKENPRAVQGGLGHCPILKKTPPDFSKTYENKNYLTPSFYRTGDLGRYLPGGDIVFRERIDQQVKIRGFRIEPGEIQYQLLKHEEIKDAVVFVRETKGGEKFICAYIVFRSIHSSHSGVLLELREYLSRMLPQYMIPTHFVPVEKIPLTLNGKVDWNALPEPETVANEEEYVPPENEIQEKLVSTWQDVLGIERVGIVDKFFMIGGDSIKAVQIAARIKKYQLNLKIDDLFLYPTVKELAEHVKETDRNIHQGTVEGEVVLTPIQRWFFLEDYKGNHHFNQSVMLYKESGFSEIVIENVFERLVQHHDVLRMVYKIEGDKIVQWNLGIKGKHFEFEIFKFEDDANSQKKIENEADRIQRSLDLEKGPLVKLGLFKTSKGDHLLIVIHHLVVDGVSWRILLEDFSIGCRQLEQGETIRFPAKTDSFKYWSQKLYEYGKEMAGERSREFREELEYWKEIEKTHVEPLPRDREVDSAKKKIKNAESVGLELNEEETETLLKKVNHAYNTEINDILLTTLGLALKAWSGNGTAAINLEGHGRESIIEDIDISRTVGWFTSQFPVILNMSNEEQLLRHIVNIKETLRRVPHRGIGYGILKYLTPCQECSSFVLEPEISFNYLGQFLQESHIGGNNRVFNMSPQKMGNLVSPESDMKYTMDIRGMIVDGKLNLSFIYNKYEFRRSSIENLVESYKTYLIKIMEHCNQKEETSRTASDFAASDLDEQEVEDIFDELEDS